MKKILLFIMASFLMVGCVSYTSNDSGDVTVITNSNGQDQNFKDSLYVECTQDGTSGYFVKANAEVANNGDIGYVFITDGKRYEPTTEYTANNSIKLSNNDMYVQSRDGLTSNMISVSLLLDGTEILNKSCL